MLAVWVALNINPRHSNFTSGTRSSTCGSTQKFCEDSLFHCMNRRVWKRPSLKQHESFCIAPSGLKQHFSSLFCPPKSSPAPLFRPCRIHSFHRHPSPWPGRLWLQTTVDTELLKSMKSIWIQTSPWQISARHSHQLPQEINSSYMSNSGMCLKDNEGIHLLSNFTLTIETKDSSECWDSLSNA